MLIEIERLILRELKDEDIRDLIEGLNHLNVSRWMSISIYWIWVKSFIKSTKINDNSKISLAIILK